MKNRIKIKKLSGGLSNDPYVGQTGSFYDGFNIDVRNDSQYSMLTESSSARVVSGKPCYIDTETIATESGYIYDYSPYTYAITRGSGAVRNRFYYNGNYYYITDSGINRQDSVGMTSDSGLLNVLPTLSAWTGGTGRTWNASNWSYTAGGGTLSANVNTTTWQNTYYKVEITATITSGSITVGIYSSGGTLQSSFTLTSSVTAGKYILDSGTGSFSSLRVTTGGFSGNITDLKACRIEGKANNESGASPDTRGIQVNAYTFDASNCQYQTTTNRPFVRYNGNIYIGNLRNVAVMDAVQATAKRGTLTNVLVLPYDEEIIGMCPLSGQIAIFTNKKEYLRDGIQTSPTAVIDRPGQIIKAVTTDGTTFIVYTTTGYDVFVWKSNGLSQGTIFRGKNNPLERICPVPDNHNDVASKTNYFIGLGQKTIFSYGNSVPGFPMALIKENVDGDVKEITCVSRDAERVGVEYNGGTYGVITLHNSLQYRSLGRVDNLIYGDNVDELKMINKMKLGYKLPNNSCGVRLYGQINGELDKFSFVVSGSFSISTGDKYTLLSNVFEVISCDDRSTYTVIYCKRITEGTTITSWGTLTKVSGSGPTTIDYTSFVNMRYIGSVLDNSVRSRTFVSFNESFYEIIIRRELFTSNTSYTPYISGLDIIYETIQDDMT